MVENKVKKHLYFAAFVLPCLVLYSIFFIYPFFQGIGISFTNWDGLTPKTPISLSKSEFEEKILNCDDLSQSDKEYVQSIYQLQNDNEYHRESIKGFTKYKLEYIIGKSDYVPEKNHFVGFENYRKIFAGEATEPDKPFYPVRKDVKLFEFSNSLPLVIEPEDFENNIIAHVKGDDESLNLVQSAYVFRDYKNQNTDKKVQEYKLTDDFKASDIKRSIRKVSEFSSLDREQMTEFTDKLEEFAESNDSTGLENCVLEFCGQYNCSEESTQFVLEKANGLHRIQELKHVLDQVWYKVNFNLGVIGFTIFFAVFSVIGINVLAFLLALALDTGIKGQKILRTAFFIPNVLSMVIVALLWSMLFTQLLPKITGVEKWLTDAVKTPWLLVLVAVWQGAGYYMIVYLAGLQNIPTDVIEAGKIDGATGWQRFRHLTLPMMMPSITISLFLTIANALKSFDLVFAMLGQTGYNTGTAPFVMDIYFTAYSSKLAGLANAKAVVLFLVIVVITGLQLFIMKRKEIES